jgi:radical SAM superfamily enzyme YgiQ (UPF0313 family)
VADSRAVLMVNPDREKPIVAPLPLDYLASSIRHASYEPELLDLALESDWYAATNHAVSSKDLLAIVILIGRLDDGLYNSQTYFLPKTRTLVEYLRSKTKAPVILIGGAYSLVPEGILRFCKADYGIACDAEDALPRLLDVLMNDGRVDGVPNIGWIDGKTFQQNPVTPCTLDQPWLSERGFIDNVRYFNEGGHTVFETKRGTTYQEIYSTDCITRGRNVRLRDPESVAEEVDNLIRQGIYSFSVDDAPFNEPRDHAIAVCEALTARKTRERARWYATCTPREFTQKLAQAMAAAGCQGVNLRVDSGDNEHLARMGHRHNPDDVIHAAEWCKSAGMLTMFHVHIGGPGESRASIERTINLTKATSPDMVSIQYGLRVYPNTPLGEAVLKHHPLRDNYHLRGAIYNNDDLLRPVFYIESLLGRGVEEYIEELIDHDPKYLFPFRKDMDKTYNYNDPTILTEAILHDGHRGDHWDIWRRLIYKLPALSLNADRRSRGKRGPRRVVHNDTATAQVVMA